MRKLSRRIPTVYITLFHFSAQPAARLGRLLQYSTAQHSNGPIACISDFLVAYSYSYDYVCVFARCVRTIFYGEEMARIIG